MVDNHRIKYIFLFLNFSGFGKRHVLILLLFSGFACLYAMRVNLSVAIVAMVGARSKGQSLHDLKDDDECPHTVAPETKHNPLKAESVSLIFVVLIV